MTGAPWEFAGRARELEVCRPIIERAAAGSGGIIVLSGEAGIGKSRLADELVARARDRGLRGFWGRACD